MWSSVGAFGLRVFLYVANLFFIVALITLAINYPSVSSIEYFRTTRVLWMIYLVYLILLILFGAVCTRKTKLPILIYRAYMVILLIAAISAIVILSFDFDKTSSVVQQFEADVAQFNKLKNSTFSLDDLQKKYKCCGLESPDDYVFEKPDSCISKYLDTISNLEHNKPEHEGLILTEKGDFEYELNGSLISDKESSEDTEKTKDNRPRQFFNQGCSNLLYSAHSAKHLLGHNILTAVILVSLATIGIVYAISRLSGE